jgi:protoheme IX farnesyltransferase
VSLERAPLTAKASPLTGEIVVVVPARARRRVVADLVALTKPRVAVMVLVTTLVGYYVGLNAAPDYPRLMHLLVGTLLAAGGTLALNQYLERDVDARMKRTQSRPLPDGRLEPLEALLFASALAVVGVLYLAMAVNLAAAGVTAAIAVLYLFAYTPLKVRTPLATLVGAVPGALPPVTGWAAARDDIALGAWVLFGIMFLWQLPHTLAIARLYRDDYARAGVRVLPVVDATGASTERQILSGTCALVAVSLLPTLIGLAGGVYFTGALVLGLGLVVLAIAQAHAPSMASARRVMFASLLYLPALFALLAYDKL